MSLLDKIKKITHNIFIKNLCMSEHFIKKSIKKFEDPKLFF